MKATGIVRRIDDLGRVVIPKEIRRTMRIREGDPPQIVNAAHDASGFHLESPPAVVVTALSIRRFLLPMQEGGVVSFGSTGQGSQNSNT